MNPVSLRELLRLAIPAAASVLLNNAFKVIDQYSVQWLGREAQAAVGSCTFILIGLFAIYSVVASGAGPLVARTTGACDFDERRRIVANALTGSVTIGTGVLIVMGFGAPWICRGLGLREDVLVLAAEYLRWLAIVGFPLVLAPLIDAVFIAVGRTALVMVLQLIATILNIVLNPVFIYRLEYGIAGAAIATGISRGVAVSLGFWLLWRQFRPGLRDFRPDRSLRRMIRIGLPLSWGIALYALVYWALLRFAISPLGPAVNAALGIGYSALEGFTWPVFWGLSLGVASLIGRYLGARRLDQAKRTIRLAVPLMSVLGLSAALIFWFGAEPLCGIFSDDPEVLREAILYARVLAFSQLFVAYESLAEGVLEGSGDTRPILWWSAPWNILRIPFAWYLAIHLGWGPAGIWWIINISTLIKAAGKWSVVLRGGWQTIRV
ncbi:MAG: MATE family efflux transporter [Methylococcaceae bacterium]|nr:MATE family efflux transporter [Methylococcaceae bacterium]MCI0734655.1 MATE family efflux transporter [Methylococcaceae bacterium]